MQVLKILIKRNKLFVLLSVCLTLIANLSQMIYMLYISKLVNNIESGTTIENSLILILCLFLISNAVTNFFNHYISRYTSEKMAHTLRTGYMRNLLHTSIEATPSAMDSGTDAAHTMSVLQNELAQANSYLGNNFFEFSGMLLTGTLVLVFLLFQNVLLTMVFTLPTVLILIYVMYSGRKLTDIVSATMDEKEKMNRIAFGLIHSFPIVKFFSGEKFCMKSYEEKLSTWGVHATHEGRMHAIYNSLSGVLSRLPLLLLFLCGGFLVLRNKMSLGTLFVFLNLQNGVTQTIMNLPSHMARFKVFTVNLSRISIL